VGVQLIRFDNVCFTYRSADGQAAALRDLSFSLSQAEVVAVLGANGSGKSTLVRMTNGLLAPDSGHVSVEGIDTVDGARTRELRELVGVVFQHPDDQIVATSVEDDVAFGPENLGLPREEIRSRVDKAVAAVGLTGLERREPHLLSGGQKQRLAIAGALAMQPRYVVLDEPMSMLDPQGRAEVLTLIADLRSAGHGVLLVTHDLAEAAIADRAVVLSGGAPVFIGEVGRLLGGEFDLAAWGLELPPIALLASRLSAYGVPINQQSLTPAGIAEALCR